MKKIFFALFVAMSMQTTYSQSLHEEKHKKLKTACRMVLNDTCQVTQSCTLIQCSNKENKGEEFSIAPLVICPIAYDIYATALSRALKGIKITY